MRHQSKRMDSQEASEESEEGDNTRRQPGIEDQQCTPHGFTKLAFITCHRWDPNQPNLVA